ncbi:MAG: hypothetical protein ACI9SG_002609, partial [Maribacter sp.]
YQMPEAEAITPGLNGDFFNLDDTTDLANKITSWFEKIKTKNREEIRLNCYKVIDDKYNPYYQASLIEDTLIANKY